jgi:hypothetical protein
MHRCNFPFLSRLHTLSLPGSDNLDIGFAKKKTRGAGAGLGEAISQAEGYLGMTANASISFLVLTKVGAGLQVVRHPRWAGI